MNDTILVRGARQLLTLHGSSGPRRGSALRDLGLIQDGAILIRRGLVHSVGSSRRIENLKEARSAREFDADGHVVMPGFVDSHTHLVFGPTRLTDYEMGIAGADYHRIAEAGRGILSNVRSVRAAPATRLQLRARHFIDGFIRHGTTTLEAKSGYGLDETGELKILRVLRALDGKPLNVIRTYLGAHAVPPEYEGKPDDYVEWMCSSVMPKIRRRKLARFADVYCDRGAFTLEQARRCLEAARQLGFLLKIHAEQFMHSGAARLAVELESASADHLEQADEDDVEILAQSSTIATLLPGSVFHLGLDRYAPARALIDRGAAVALATDFNPGTSPTYNMQIILSLACTQMRMTPAEAISAATINGAHALRCADRTGSLESGKNADLIFLNVSDYREIPYHFGVNLVAMTMKKGFVVYREAGIKCPED